MLLMAIFWMATPCANRVLAQKVQAIADFRCQLYSYYVSSDMQGWLQTLSVMEQQLARTKNDSLALEVIRTQYGFVAWALGNDQKSSAAPILDKALSSLNRYIEQHPKDAEALALKSSLLGFKIALNPLKAAFIGPKTVEIIDAAMAMAPKNPWVMLEKANAEQYTPKLFGGDPTYALSLYRSCLDILAKQRPQQCSWSYLNLYINLAFCYTKLKQYNNAMATYNKLLAIAPNFKWVKEELIPNLKRKMAQNTPA